METRGRRLKYKVSTQWSCNLAYAIGLLTSDGNLSKDGRHMGLISKDLELIKKFCTALKLNNRITPAGRGGSATKPYFVVRFGDKNFFNFLNSIGLTPAKSKTIKAVEIPDNYFPDFLRGLFDGDGSFYSYWDKRWPNSFVYQISFCSASLEFMIWLKQKLSELYKVKGFIRKGVGVYVIRYVKRDTRILSNIMYYNSSILFLNRKYYKIQTALSKPG